MAFHLNGSYTSEGKANFITPSLDIGARIRL
jgi:hypothetical protein